MGDVNNRSCHQPVMRCLMADIIKWDVQQKRRRNWWKKRRSYIWKETEIRIDIVSCTINISAVSKGGNKEIFTLYDFWKCHSDIDWSLARVFGKPYIVSFLECEKQRRIRCNFCRSFWTQIASKKGGNSFRLSFPFEILRAKPQSWLKLRDRIREDDMH